SLRELIGIIVDVNVGPGITGNTYLGCSVTVDVDHDRIFIGCPSLANNLSKGNASLSVDDIQVLLIAVYHLHSVVVVEVEYGGTGKSGGLFMYFLAPQQRKIFLEGVDILPADERGVHLS